MSRILAWPVILAALSFGGCSSGPEETSEPAAPVEAAPAPEASAGRCSKCHSEVLDGHLCGKTMPCRLCAREAGMGHRHRLVWRCTPCGQTYSASHVCQDARACPTCRPDGVRIRPARACQICDVLLLALDVVPATTYCSTCNLEVARGHIHGKTKYCGDCEREAGEGHLHQATRLCVDCESEVAPDHEHGVTAFCRSCGRDQGLDHVHGRTEWCLKCKAEKEPPHTVHTP